MNGDFLALLPKSLLPSLAPSSRAPQPLEATTVFAFHCADGALFAGDHRATAGNIIFSDKAEKILEIDARSMMAIAGSPAVAFEMARTLETAFEFYRRSQLQSMSLPAKIRALSRLLRDNLPAALQGVGLVSPIFAGVEPGTGRPAIYFYDPLGAQFEAASYAGSGSGSGSIKSVLHFLEMWGQPRPDQMNLSQAVNLANRLLITAAEFDTATGGVAPEQGDFATIKLLSSDGIRTISHEEQLAFWREGVS
jgi:proteasome beta subunit